MQLSRTFFLVVSIVLVSQGVTASPLAAKLRARNELANLQLEVRQIVDAYLRVDRREDNIQLDRRSVNYNIQLDRRSPSDNVPKKQQTGEIGKATNEPKDKTYTKQDAKNELLHPGSVTGTGKGQKRR